MILAHMLINPGRTAREELAAYVARGGYRGLMGLGPEQIIAQVEAARLRGRGGSGLGLPVSAKWREVAKGAPGQRYVVANGAETSPGSRKDQHLLETCPHAVLEGAAAAALAVGADTVYLYIKATASQAIASLESALQELSDLRRDLPWPTFELFRAPNTMVSGEETAACDAIHGFEGRPWVKPPLPATCGVFARPTLVTNVETLAAVAAVLREGSEAFLAAGSPTLFTLSGDVNRPGVYELPLGTPLRHLIEECGGGAVGEVVAVLPGGYHSGPLTGEELDLPLEYDAMQAAGTTLGLGHVVVLARTDSLAELFTGSMQLVAMGSCRQCGICAEGTAQLYSLASQLANGGDEAALREELTRWAALLHGKGNCGLPTGASTLVRRAVSAFPSWREGSGVGGHR